MNQTLLVVALVLLVVANARMLPREPWSGEIGGVRSLGGSGAVEMPRRQKRSFRFRGYWSCPIGYIRSPAAICVECGEYEMITGIPCDNMF
uniref:Uncharacterized protein n=1 Tax=Papilio xuthus TaxID=66420 RepID=I4DKK8_PAPXU|nr:uncharacterized protein LOC106125794 precursor [Papilio xuthus]BAM18448.1 unknown secreted protein [Papilio xuthus]